MQTNVVSKVVNIILNYLLIEGHFGFPALVIRSAAIATVIGTVCVCSMSIASLFRKSSYVRIPYAISERAFPTFTYLRQIFHLAFSEFVEQIFLRTGFLMVSLMEAKLATHSMMIYHLGMNIMTLSFSLGDGMQVAAVTLIDQSLGRKHPDVEKRYGTICQEIGLVISVFLSIMYLLFSEWFYSLYFQGNKLAISIGTSLMRLMTVIVHLQISMM